MMSHLSTLGNVPAAALPMIAQEISRYGVYVQFETPLNGYAESISGSAVFRHDGAGNLTVHITRDCHHFPRSMLVGGFRQLVEETLEVFYKYPRRA